MEKQENISLDLVNKQISELKKKLILSETKKKANYEEWDSAKKQNTGMIKRFKEEIKELYSKLSEKYDSKPRGKICTQNEMTLLLNKGNEDALQNLDLKVIDMQKRLDLLYHQVNQKQDKLNQLWSEGKPKVSAIKNVFKKSFNSKPVTTENRTHLVEMNIMEADHLRKKYKTIRTQLLDEGVAFESILNKLEQKITNEEAEVYNLEKVCKEAKQTKIVADSNLSKEEKKSLELEKQRITDLNQLKSKVQYHKSDLERLEKQVFSSKKSSLPPTSDSDGAETDAEYPSEMLELASFHNQVFSELKEATGVTNNENVLKRFLSQKETKSILENLKIASTKEKYDLENCKDQIIAELNKCKFAHGKSTEQNSEEISRIKLKIQKKMELLDEIQHNTNKMQQQVHQVLNQIHSFCFQLQDADNAKVPEKCPPPEKSEWILSLLKTKIESAVRQQHQASTKFIGEKLKFSVSPQLLGSEIKLSDIEEEEEIPTRNSLKKEAQLIYETKSRKRGYRIHTAKHIQF